MAATWTKILVKGEIVANGTETAGNASRPINIKAPSSGNPTEFQVGTGAGKANKIHSGAVVLAISTPQTLDLTSLSYGLGDSGLSKVKGWRIENTHASASLTVGNAASNPFPFNLGTSTTTVTIAPGGVWEYYEPTANGISCATAKNVKLDPGASAITVNLEFFGE